MVGAIAGSEDGTGDGFEVVGSDVEGGTDGSDVGETEEGSAVGNDEGSAVGDDEGSAVGDDVYAIPSVATLMFVPSTKSVR